MNNFLWHITVSLLIFAAVVMLLRHGWPGLLNLWRRQERWYQRVLGQQLLLDIEPRSAMLLSLLAVIFTALVFAVLMGGWLWLLIGAALGLTLPYLVVRHLERRRFERLESQLVDGITTLASGIRAGLNLVQAMELLINHSVPPIKQEFAQLLREYNLGLDLNHAMHNAANRIGSSHYRLLFTAMEMHRRRGGDAGQTLDRLAESIREIQRLEGKLDALTAHGRMQARMMAAAPVIILGILYVIDPRETSLLFTEPMGRLLLLGVVVLIVAAFVWIRKILAIDI